MGLTPLPTRILFLSLSPLVGIGESSGEWFPSSALGTDSALNLLAEMRGEGERVDMELEGVDVVLAESTPSGKISGNSQLRGSKSSGSMVVGITFRDVVIFAKQYAGEAGASGAGGEFRLRYGWSAGY